MTPCSHDHVSSISGVWIPVSMIDKYLNPDMIEWPGAYRDVQIARTKERNCSSCHSAMSLAYSAVQFLEKSQHRQQQQQQTMIGSSLTSDARQREDRTQSQLIPGTALPAKGTCKHYPHSYRWLRFPCCGKRFPCDLCHEEESDGHHMKWAYRHVCGFCSTEQVIQLRLWLHSCILPVVYI